MTGDQIFWLLRGAQFLPLDAQRPGNIRPDLPGPALHPDARSGRRAARRRIAGFLGRS